MTKQGEIREGIAKLDFNRFNEVFMDGKVPAQCYKFADKILSYLDSQGVYVLVENILLDEVYESLLVDDK